MAVSPPSLVLEICQTREFTSREKRDLTRLWEKLVWREGVDRWYTASAYLWYGFGALLALSVLMAVKRLSDVAPNLSGQLALAAIGYAASVVAAQWATKRLYREKYWTGRRTGDRFTVTADGLHAASFRGRYECRWGTIETVINDSRHLVATLPGSGGLFIVKAAFESQDVERFTAELVRRWREGRAGTTPGFSA